MNEFDIKTLFRTIKASKRTLLINCGIAFIVGIVISFSIPKEYSASCTLAPESQEEGMAGGLSSIASMAGINLGSGMDAIGPELYPEVISSNDFIVNLLYINIKTIDGKEMKYLDYMRNETKHPWWYAIKKMFTKLMKKINPQPQFTKSVGKDARINPERMSMEDESLVKSIKDMISCSVSDLDNTISIRAMAQDPLVAKLVVDSVSVHLQDFVTMYRTNKARIDLDYYKNIETETWNQYLQAQKNYADYCDTHVSIFMQAYETQRDALENEMSIAMSAYTQVKQQVQMAEAKVQEKTPAFTTLEKSSVPNKHDSPRKIIITLALMFVTLIFTLGWIYIKLLYFTKPEKEKTSL